MILECIGSLKFLIFATEGWWLNPNDFKARDGE